MTKRRSKKQTETTKREPISRKQRFDIFNRDHFTCQYCGQKAPAVVLHVDHIKPVAKGGTNDKSNLTTACSACNSGKSATEIINHDKDLDLEREKNKETLQKVLDRDSHSCVKCGCDNDIGIVLSKPVGQFEYNYSEMMTICKECSSGVVTARDAIHDSLSGLFKFDVQFCNNKLSTTLFNLFETAQEMDADEAEAFFSVITSIIDMREHTQDSVFESVVQESE